MHIEGFNVVLINTSFQVLPQRKSNEKSKKVTPTQVDDYMGSMKSIGEQIVAIGEQIAKNLQQPTPATKIGQEILTVLTRIADASERLVAHFENTDWFFMASVIVL